MNTSRVERKGRSYWWLALLLPVCLTPCAIPIAFNGDPRAIVARIPLGSKLSDLDGHLGSNFDSSEVDMWLRSRHPDSTSEPRKTDYGEFFVGEIGPYDAWKASKAERDRFTGEIFFFHHSWVIPDDLAPSYAIWLVYVDGVLKARDYGYLPG